MRTTIDEMKIKTLSIKDNKYFLIDGDWYRFEVDENPVIVGTSTGIINTRTTLSSGYNVDYKCNDETSLLLNTILEMML